MASYDDTATVSGSVAHIADGASKVPVESCVISLVASLNGYTEANVNVTEKNLLNPTTCQRGYITSAGTISNPGTTTQELYSDYIKVNPGVSYTFSATVNNDSEKWRGVAFYDKDKTFIKRTAATSGTNASFSISATTPDNAYYLRCTWRNYSDISSGGSVCECQFEEGSATAYEAYKNTIKTANLGQTVYGADVDIAKGSGSKSYNGVDLSTLSWSSGKLADVWVWYTSDLSNPELPENANIFDGLCDSYTPIRYNGVAANTGTIAINNSGVLYVNNGGNTTEPTGHITYKLATATDFTFTGQAIETSGEVENWWADNDISVSYHDNAHGFASVTVNRAKKNLLLPDRNQWSPVELNGVTRTYSLEDQEIALSGTNEKTDANWLIFNGNTFNLDGIRIGATYTFSHTLSQYCYAQVTYYNTSNQTKVLVSLSGIAAKNASRTFTVPDDFVKLKDFQIGVYRTSTNVSEVSKFQIEEGDQKSAFEPYEAPENKTAYLHKVIFGGLVDVIQGKAEPKNILELYLARTSQLDVYFSLTDYGLLHVEGTNSSSTSSAFSGGNYNDYESCPWKFPSGTYTISSIVTADNAKIGTVYFAIRTKTDNTKYEYRMKDSSSTFTVDDDFGAWFWVSVLKSETVNADVGIQLEKGSTSTDFAPHFDPFTFPPISMETDEGENTLYADQGDSAITYRKES